MNRQIRRGVFETNSSSVHSITMCMKSDFDKWKSKELVFDEWNDVLVPVTEDIKKSMEEDGDQFLTYEQFFYDENRFGYETFKEDFTTPTGEEVISFGYYGENR